MTNLISVLRHIFLLLAFSHAPIWANDQATVVYAASSLAPSLREIREAFLLHQQEGFSVEFNFASSSVLARQIEYGANSNLYISANKRWVDYLDREGLLKSNSTKLLLSNQLVLAASLYLNENLKREFRQMENAQVSMDENAFFETAKNFLSSHTPLIIADPAYVPLGEYSKEALTHLGLYSTLSHKLIPANNARAALAFLERGQADFAMLYRSDAVMSDKLFSFFSIPDSYYSVISYYVAHTYNSSAPVSDATKAFYQFLFSEEAQNIFRKNGFALIKL